MRGIDWNFEMIYKTGVKRSTYKRYSERWRNNAAYEKCESRRYKLVADETKKQTIKSRRFNKISHKGEKRTIRAEGKGKIKQKGIDDDSTEVYNIKKNFL